MSHDSLYDEWGEPMPPGRPLRLLFYVDDRRFLCDYGTRRLQDALRGGLIDTHVDVLARPLGHKLTKELLDKYDEVWFFLRSLAAEDLLSTDEVAALHGWMNRGGGVLIAGDHCEKLESLEKRGVGAPVGLCIPRARDLRCWDDGPGMDEDVSFDTTEHGHKSLDADAKLFERDERPQRLLLPTHSKHPHPIFRDSMGRWLDRFPDHRHEGRVQVTERGRHRTLSSEPEWPASMNSAESPRLIASGINWRRGEVRELMAEWDGHRFKTSDGTRYGRILADSSFHHYVDDNLTEIAIAGGGNWRKLRELYRNQAAWLAPPAIRDAYTERAIAWARAQPCYQELKPDESKLVIYELLTRALPAAYLHEYGDAIATRLDVESRQKLVQEALPQHLLAAVVELNAIEVLTTNERPSRAVRDGVLKLAIDSYASAAQLGVAQKLDLTRSIL